MLAEKVHDRTVSDIWERDELISKKTAAEAASLRAIRKAVKQSTRFDGNGETVGGNGFTVLKYREPSISRLLKSGRIGGEEMRAIEEIEQVYYHLCASSILRGHQIRERTGGGKGDGDPAWFIDGYRRYKAWADKWSMQKKLNGNPMLEIVFDILFSAKSGHSLDTERGWKHGLATSLFVSAVRDYSAMSGWVDRNTASNWSSAAMSVFPLRRVRKRTA